MKLRWSNGQTASIEFEAGRPGDIGDGNRAVLCNADGTRWAGI